MLNQKDITRFFIYDPETGIFTRRIDWYGAKAGTAVGVDDGAGYIQIGMNGKVYRAHRMAWVYMTGENPRKVDHKNGIRSDNRWCNLQKANDTENCRNKGQVSGVSRVTGYDTWAARIQINRRVYHLGVFKDRELAELVAAEARDKYFGEFYRGRHA